MTTKNNNDNKSLFLYTSLIFIVAILLIIIAFFGQTNVQKNQPEVEVEETSQPSANSGITEKASVLSEENRVLLEEKAQLEETIEEKDESIKNLENENQSLKEQIQTNDLLLQAYGYLTVGNNEKASEKLNSLNYDSLSSDQQIIYNNVKSELE